MIIILSSEHEHGFLPFKHRDTRCIDIAMNDWYHTMINGARIFCCKLESDNKWWIIARSSCDDERHTDVGPFDDPENAIAIMKLMADPT